jgi:hypothetical protein
MICKREVFPGARLLSWNGLNFSDTQGAIGND